LGGSLVEFLLLNHLYLLEAESTKVELSKGTVEFRDMVGRLTVLRVACDKCGQQGEHELEHLIERYGPFGKIDEWSKRAMVVDCPRRLRMNDPCGSICPDLAKAV
jgi:hypothetical protein